MTIQAQYIYKPLVSSSDPSFDEFYGIYVESIPLREQKLKTQISAIATNSDYKVLLLKKNTVAIGFSILFTPAKESFCLLEYMAVHSAYRNLGLGRQLFLRTFQDVFSNRGPVHGLLEIDSDREQSADQEIRRRRQHFYRRLGCLRIDSLSYVLPLHGEGPPPQMDLMVYLPGRLPLISRHQLEHWLKVIYSKVYDCSADDPRIAQMIEDIGDPVKLV
ncbi:MAG: GNAT family N-acetyltransferase [Desulfobacteria bacterium]